MRLEKLSVTNYRVIRSTHVVFPDAVIGIIGDNGTGKSSLVEAMAWALYGNTAARSIKDEIRSSMADAAGTLARPGAAETIVEELFRLVFGETQEASA